MVLVYSYEKACNILELFNQNKIVSLRIYLNNSLGKENAKYVFDFKTYEDYPEEEHIKIRSEFNEKNLQMLNQAVAKVNEFITMMEVDNVVLFDLTFDILKKEFSCSKAYKKAIKEVEGTEQTESYSDFINKLEKYITQNGIHKINIPGLYEKIPGSGKRGVKYNPVSFGELICKLKDVITDNGEDGE